MLRVELLKVKNFKSYKGCHTFGPFDNFSAVIGENGTGKSNCFDAICFVLGATANSMRCHQLSSLIYNGHQTPYPKSASVTLIFTNDFQIKRKILKNGSSTYSINDNKKTAAEYKESLLQLGFPPRLQSFIIFQGDIQQLACMKPMELTTLIEEISGSIKFKKNYENAENEFKIKQENVAILDEQREDLSKKKRVLKKEAEEARKWKELDEKMITTNKELIDFQLYQSSYDLKVAEEKVSEMEGQISNKKRQLNEIDEALQSTESTIQTTQKCHKVSEKEEKKVKKMLQNKRTENESINASKNETEKLIENMQNEVKMNSEKLEEEKKTKSTLTKLINAFQKKNKLFIQNKDKINSINEEITAFENSSSKNLQNQQELENFELKLANEKDNKTRFQNQIEYNDKIIHDADDEMSKIPQIEEPASRKDGTLREMNQIQDKIDALNSQLRQIKRISYTNKRINRLSSMLHVLQQNIPNVYGFVRDLCRPVRPKYENAVAYSLTYHLDEIIVKDVETANKCIEMCKMKNLGNCTFLPLNHLKYNKKDNLNTKDDALVKPIIDLLEYEERDLQAIEYVTKNIFYCENPKDALEKYRTKKWKKITDKNGTIYYKNGIITGGSVRGHQNYNTKRSPEAIKNEIKELEEKYDNLRQQMRNDDEIYQKKKRESEKSMAMMKLLEQKKNQSLDNLLHLNDLCLKTENNIEMYESQIQHLKVLIEKENVKRKKDYKSLIEKLSKDNQDLLKLFKVSDITDLLESFKIFVVEANENKENKKKLNYLEDSVLQNTLSNSKASLVQMRSQLSQQIEPSRLLIEEEVKKLEELHEEAKNQILKTNNDLQCAKNEKSRILSARKKVVSDLSSTETMIIDNKNNAKSAKKNLEYLLTQLDTTETIDSIKNADFSALPALMKQPKSILQRKNIISNYQEKINGMKEMLDSRPPNFRAEESLSKIKDEIHLVDEELQKKRKEMMASGNNFRSIKKQRHQTFMATFDVVAVSIQNIYSKLTRTAKQPLGGAAFLSPMSPQNPFLDGIVYSVLPPLKRLRAISLLSGGEQALAVVSLIFALNEAKPSPCFVLDEIDAALDKCNTNKLSSFLKSMSSTKQIIVVSHRDRVYSEADTLIGICKDVNVKSSCAYTFKLSKILENTGTGEQFEEPESLIRL